ncbi:hypothetical protein F5X68DRAFT_51420 [Plectosphaerella plurivora]|uniref:Pentatricopeptide repeat domain-containing protein n=1 Tax=Plectosphaerella plurivora TaxID=936078 RepID=A0A9P8V2M1_9PEZI|nr:hypothetical protein F5X68DRAFT_51420 [Plectosphaerella plurivora]
MPQALQWLGHWNRASFTHWHLWQVLPKSRQHNSCNWRYDRPRCLSTPSGRRSNQLKPTAAYRRQHSDPHSPQGVINPTNRLSEPTGARTLRCEDDLDSFEWKDFVTSPRESARSSKRWGGAKWNTEPGHHYNTEQLCHELVVAQRRAGRDGVLQFWSTLVEQRGLSKVEGAEADFFYQSVLEAALPNDVILEGILLYADWLVDGHDIRWPRLYDRVVSYCLESRQFARAVRWHMRLMSGFDPGQAIFTKLITQHVHKTDAQEALRSMYIASHHRNAYDHVIPRLHGCGKSTLAMQWRDLLVQYGDLPLDPVASQPFLHFLHAYYRGKSLTAPEDSLASSEPRYRATAHMSHDESSSKPTRQDSPTPANDAIGARFLASSWIGPEFAVHALQGLGVHSLGPLSLQSLALRDPKPASVLARLEQLETLEIHVVESTYVKSIRHFAAAGNDELLLALLQSDIHPDVFDDEPTQSQILANAIATGDRQTSQLLLAIRPIVARHSMHSVSNERLRDRLLRHDVRAAIGLMDDMRAMKVDIDPDTMETICSHLLAATDRDLPISLTTKRAIQDNVALACGAASFQRTLPSQIWKNLLYQLGRSGQQTALETLVLFIVDGFQTKATGEGALVRIHHADLPPWSTHIEVADVPVDLSIRHLWHPINRILGSRSVQASIIRWGFNAGLPLSHNPQLQDVAGTCTIKDFNIARGARLLRQLAKRGIPLHRRRIRHEIVSCIASHMEPEEKRAVKSPRHISWASLCDIRQLFRIAFGQKILPHAPILRVWLLRAIRQDRARGSERPPHV